ncbi:hypothetical protein DFH09DRAFT_1097979 [Mycena vulgaris]|nr:hypothetical protein DFH09DRAFT_1097979 [Mycena vulgaris]
MRTGGIGIQAYHCCEVLCAREGWGGLTGAEDSWHCFDAESKIARKEVTKYYHLSQGRPIRNRSGPDSRLPVSKEEKRGAGARTENGMQPSSMNSTAVGGEEYGKREQSTILHNGEPELTGSDARYRKAAKYRGVGGVKLREMSRAWRDCQADVKRERSENEPRPNIWIVLSSRAHLPRPATSFVDSVPLFAALSPDDGAHAPGPAARGRGGGAVLGHLSAGTRPRPAAPHLPRPSMLPPAPPRAPLTNAAATHPTIWPSPRRRPRHPHSPPPGLHPAGRGNTVSPSPPQRLGPHCLISLFDAGPMPEHPTTARRPLRFELSLFTAGEPRPFSGQLYEKGPYDLVLIVSIIMLSFLPLRSQRHACARARDADSLYAECHVPRQIGAGLVTLLARTTKQSTARCVLRVLERAGSAATDVTVRDKHGTPPEHRVTTSSVTQAARDVLRQGSAHLAVYYTYPNTSTVNTDISQRTALWRAPAAPNN